MNKLKTRICKTAVKPPYALQATTYHGVVLSGSHDIIEMTPLALVMCLVFVLTASQIGGCGFSLPSARSPPSPVFRSRRIHQRRAREHLDAFPPVTSVSAWIPVIHNLGRQNSHRPSWARFQHFNSSSAASSGKHADVVGILRTGTNKYNFISDSGR